MSDFVNAARDGDIARMRHLITVGDASVNEAERDTKLTALHAAAANLNEATTYVLLSDQKADPHLKDAQGRRALDIAVETGHEKNIQMLYEATHAKNILSIAEPAHGERSTILPYQTIEHHAQAQKDNSQGR